MEPPCPVLFKGLPFSREFTTLKQKIIFDNVIDKMPAIALYIFKFHVQRCRILEKSTVASKSSSFLVLYVFTIAD